VVSWKLLIIASWLIYYTIRNFSKEKEYFNTTVPNQLVQLVRQAHAGVSFLTEWNIYVSENMREKLCYPLTLKQVEILKPIKFTPQEGIFEYSLHSYKHKKGMRGELSGIVLVTIQYHDISKNIHINYVNTPIYLRCDSKPGAGWELTHVEYPQSVY